MLGKKCPDETNYTVGSIGGQPPYPTPVDGGADAFLDLN